MSRNCVRAARSGPSTSVFVTHSHTYRTQVASLISSSYVACAFASDPSKEKKNRVMSATVASSTITVQALNRAVGRSSTLNMKEAVPTNQPKAKKKAWGVGRGQGAERSGWLLDFRGRC